MARLIGYLWLITITCWSLTVNAQDWTAYFGSHYRAEAWADSIRDPQGAGFFSAEYSAEQLALLAKLGSHKQLVYSPGGLGSGRSEAAVDHYLTHMLLTLGEDWKTQLQANIAKIPTSAAPAYWQFGNEINSRRFSETIAAWDGAPAGGRPRPGRAHDAATVPYYVEYYLAPGVAAIRSSTHSERVKVVLGSLAAAANPRAQAFLDALLNYQVQGLMATSLKGKRVYELVDVIALHYIASANTPQWRSTLDQLHKKWLATGKVAAIWSTEEVGLQRATRNEGAAAGLMVVARTMDWWLSKGMPPEQGRAFLWGADKGHKGTTAAEAMQALYDTIGKSHWQVLSQPAPLSGDNLEVYGFALQPSGRQLWFAMPADQRRGARVAVSSSLSNSLNTVVAAYRYSPQGEQRGLPNTGFELAPGSALWLLLEAKK